VDSLSNAQFFYPQSLRLFNVSVVIFVAQALFACASTNEVSPVSRLSQLALADKAGTTAYHSGRKYHEEGILPVWTGSEWTDGMPLALNGFSVPEEIRPTVFFFPASDWRISDIHSSLTEPSISGADGGDDLGRDATRRTMNRALCYPRKRNADCFWTGRYVFWFNMYSLTDDLSL